VHKPLLDVYERILFSDTRNVIIRSKNYPEFKENTIESLLRRLSWGIHWQCLAIIADEYKTNGVDRYEILESRLETNQMRILSMVGIDKVNSMPDIVDRERKFAADIKITFCNDWDFEMKEKQNLSKVDSTTHLWMFSYKGKVNERALLDLDKIQINKVLDNLISLCNALQEIHFWDLFVSVMSTEGEALRYKPSSMWAPRSEWKRVIVAPSDESELESFIKSSMQQWIQIKRLPAIPDLHKLKRQGFIEYKLPFLGTDALRKEFPAKLSNSDANGKLVELFNTENFELLKSADHKKALICLSIVESVLKGTPLTEEQNLHFGIGLKKDKFKFAVDSNLKDYNTKRAEPQPKNYHPWITAEIYELALAKPALFEPIVLPLPKTIVDELGYECCNKVFDIITKTPAYEMLLKTENTMAKASSYATNSHKYLIPIPIKIESVKGGSLLYGVMIKGESNLKADSDRMNFISFEFCKEPKEEFDVKYPKHHFFKVGTYFVAVRLSATWPLKMHFHSTAKRSVIPVVNAVNRIWFSQCATKREQVVLDFDFIVERSNKEITLEEWTRKVFSIHVQMALGNDSQLEAYCADIRRMQMFTRVLQQSDRRLFLLKSGKPQNKVAESVINNPLVAFLSNCWNAHADLFNMELLARDQAFESTRSYKRSASEATSSGNGS